MSALTVSGLRKSFGEVRALDGLDFTVEEGELFCVVGPTNAGKSTLLKTIAGLHKPDAGTIHIKGHRADTLQPRDRGVSLLFQNIALFPLMTGFDNIAFPMRTAGAAESEVGQRVREVARLLRVEHVLDRLPRTFSGGEQQRVAIGRAIVRPADLLLLDEPLTNLDARIRIALRMEFKKLHRETGQTMVYVTHDQVEAMSLSDRIAVLNQGRFEQIGTPDDVYHRPRTHFVARFIGTPPMNVLAAELDGADGQVALRTKAFAIALSGNPPSPRLPQRVGLGVRPEEIRVAPEQGPSTPFPAEVLWVERLGAKSILDVRLGDEMVKVVVPPDAPVGRAGPAWLGFEARSDRLLDLGTGLFVR